MLGEMKPVDFLPEHKALAYPLIIVLLFPVLVVGFTTLINPNPTNFSVLIIVIPMFLSLIFFVLRGRVERIVFSENIEVTYFFGRRKTFDYSQVEYIGKEGLFAKWGGARFDTSIVNE